jgi:hypothetical protein
MVRRVIIKLILHSITDQSIINITLHWIWHMLRRIILFSLARNTATNSNESTLSTKASMKINKKTKWDKKFTTTSINCSYLKKRSACIETRRFRESRRRLSWVTTLEWRWCKESKDLSCLETWPLLMLRRPISPTLKRRKRWCQMISRIAINLNLMNRWTFKMEYHSISLSTTNRDFQKWWVSWTQR